MLKIECMVFGEETEREETVEEEQQEAAEAAAKSSADDKAGKSVDLRTEEGMPSKMSAEENPLDQKMMKTETNAFGRRSEDKDQMNVSSKEKRTRSLVDFLKDQNGQKEEQSSATKLERANER